ADVGDQEAEEAREHDARERERRQHLDQREPAGRAGRMSSPPLHWARIMPPWLTVTVLALPLPLSVRVPALTAMPLGSNVTMPSPAIVTPGHPVAPSATVVTASPGSRSEERRVGKGGGWPR